jgi:hypothetical protein
MNPNHNKQRRASKLGKETKQDTSLVLCRAGILYGLKYKDIVTEEISSKTGLVVTPNVVFNANQTEVFFDFSDYKNVSGTKEEFNKFWKRTKVGDTFTVTNAELYNETFQEKYDISGSYTISEIGDQIIYATVGSVEKINQNISLYSKLDFLNTPVFDIVISDTFNSEVDTTVIVNAFGINSKNSFTYLGVSIGDFIQIQDKESSYQILDFKVDNEGKELIKIKGDIPDEDRNTTKTLIKVLIKTIPNVEYPNVSLDSSAVLGSCEYSENDIVVKCFENQTNDQCQLRRKTNKGKIDFSVGKNCTGSPVYSRNINEKTTPATISKDEVIARILKDVSGQINNNSKSGRVF